MSTLHIKQHDRATITASGVGPILRNPGGKRHILIVDVPTAPTGTSPTLVFEVDASFDGITFTRKGAVLATISGIGTQVTRYGAGATQGQLVEPLIQVKWTLGGTVSPTFTNVTTTLSAVDC